MEYVKSYEVFLTVIDDNTLRLSPISLFTDEMKKNIKENKLDIIEHIRSFGIKNNEPTSFSSWELGGHVIRKKYSNKNDSASSTKDMCVCAQGQDPASAAPTLCQFDYHASGNYLHTLYNQLRRQLKQEPDNAPLLQELEQLMERIDEHWGNPQFKQGWCYG